MSQPLDSIYSYLSSLHGKENGKVPSDWLLETLNEFYNIMSKDVFISFFFAGKNLKAIAKRQQEFLLKNMSPDFRYEGKPPGKAHDGLAPIKAGHFDRRHRILEEVLRKNKLPEPLIKEWIDFELLFRDQVMNSPTPCSPTKA